MTHSLEVERLALRIARHWHVPCEPVSAAALLHDCAKGLSLPQLQQAALDGDIMTDKIVWQSRALLHAPVGAYLARKEYGLEDSEALEAIRWHTTGRPSMTQLEKIIYLADMTEPGRKAFEQLAGIRQQIWIDLDEAMLRALRCTVEHLEAHKQPIQAITLETLRWFESVKSEKVQS